jgi:hypothetical protein
MRLRANSRAFGRQYTVTGWHTQLRAGDGYRVGFLRPSLNVQRDSAPSIEALGGTSGHSSGSSTSPFQQLILITQE